MCTNGPSSTTQIANNGKLDLSALENKGLQFVFLEVSQNNYLLFFSFAASSARNNRVPQFFPIIIVFVLGICL